MSDARQTRYDRRRRSCRTNSEFDSIRGEYRFFECRKTGSQTESKNRFIRFFPYRYTTLVNTLFTRTTDLDPMDRRSSGCDCFKFVGETPAFCCGNGQHTIISHPPHADYLQRLFDGSDVNSEHFLANIRKYNCAFQMTSKSNNYNYVTSNIITYVFGVIAIPGGASLESYNYLHTMITISINCCKSIPDAANCQQQN